ncbi:Fic family protein [Microlunatus parietis]|uniref:Prophage maintenance system killer protein n=1 Tax=Microlunatus parietis TaxID=682979 RepID=A0A7Y9IE26_9ACTN|nr:Fic family protein [Microlunatus parietis]NYE75037.1 prophage maintenance system killer protein [Microlunatus parietis]
MSRITVSDLAGVVYSSGKVFDGLSTGRLDTENFLRSGSVTGVRSRADLALLEDLRDVSQFIIDHSDRPIDVAFVKAVNAQLTRTAALSPGEFRTQEQRIGVRTRYGRHEPEACTDESLQRLLDKALSSHDDPNERALEVFVQLAKAQPFEDGNKRTALFVPNGLLIGSGNGKLLTIPVDEDDPGLADTFNDLLARAYVMDEHEGVKELLRDRGLSDLRA